MIDGNSFQTEAELMGIKVGLGRRIADSLDCVFVYGFVPRTSLEGTIGHQAKKVATRQLSKASQTMSLENQALSREENEKAISDMVNELIRTVPSNLWNKQ